MSGWIGGLVEWDEGDTTYLDESRSTTLRVARRGLEIELLSDGG